ncbi:MAG: hypothetical protein KDC53_10380 [Saprospiraceae bacterium]|nr:hypothetical protein [Saprospiraceae bacterium]
MMRKKIKTLHDLKIEKKLLKAEIDATERLLLQSLQLSKEELLDSASDAVFSLFRNKPVEFEDITDVVTSQFYNNGKKGWKKFMPLMPFVLKIAGYVFDLTKKKKNKSKGKDVILHKVS